MAHRDNPDNRWWYASLQLVVFGNAKAAALCCFSAYLDGNVMMRGAAEIVRRAAAAPSLTPRGRCSRFASCAGRWASRRSTWRTRTAAVARRSARGHLRVRGLRPALLGRGEGGCCARLRPGARSGVPPAHRQVPLMTQFLTMSRYRCTDLVTAMVTTPEVEAFVAYAVGDAAGLARAREAAPWGHRRAEGVMRRPARHEPADRLPSLHQLGPSKRTFRGVTKRTATSLLFRARAL